MRKSRLRDEGFTAHGCSRLLTLRSALLVRAGGRSEDRRRPAAFEGEEAGEEALASAEEALIYDPRNPKAHSRAANFGGQEGRSAPLARRVLRIPILPIEFACDLMGVTYQRPPGLTGNYHPRRTSGAARRRSC
jgi:hypothetical protein